MSGTPDEQIVVKKDARTIAMEIAFDLAKRVYDLGEDQLQEKAKRCAFLTFDLYCILTAFSKHEGDLSVLRRQADATALTMAFELSTNTYRLTERVSRQQAKQFATFTRRLFRSIIGEERPKVH